MLLNNRTKLALNLLTLFITPELRRHLLLLQGWVLPLQVEATYPVLGTLTPSDLILVYLCAAVVSCKPIVGWVSCCPFIALLRD